jgi:hypothetical protein
MSTQSGALTLSEVCDEYLINRMIDKKKNFASYMVIAKRSWQKIFWNTVWATQSSWHTVKNGLPYDYIELPRGISRFLTASIQDPHGLIQPLFYSSQLNIIPKPSKPSCGCGECQCDGMCDDISASSVTTKLLFTINGVNYYEKEWIKTCKNGDLIKWREVPVKKYNDFVGESGDFNDDYNSDYSNANASTGNFSIVTQTFQEKVCTLEVRPCGCPLNTPQNIELINTCCAGFFPYGWRRDEYMQSNSPLSDVNSNCYGEVKLSECGTKLYFKPTKKWWQVCPPDKLIPTYILINFQTNGLSCTEETLVPEYALDYMHASMDWRAKRFNSKYSLGEKQQAKYEMNDAENKVVAFLNPINLQEVANIQDAPIRF